MNKNIIITVVVVGIALAVIYSLITKKEKDISITSPKVEDIKEKRQNIKVPPIETTEHSSLEEQTTNNKNSLEDTKKENESIFEQRIQEDPKVPEYTQADNIPKLLSVEEPTTDESMKKSEVIHNNLKIETIETTTKDS